MLKQGYITALVPFHGSRNSSKKLFIYYYYHDRAGNKIAAEDYTNDMKLLAFYKPEDAITIAVSTEDNSKSCIVPQQLAKLPEWKVR